MNIIVFGDSIAQGFYDVETGGWVTLLFGYLQKKTLDSDFAEYNSVFNQSISGEDTSQILSRFKAEINVRLDEEDKNVIIFAGGINDARRLLPSNDLQLSLDTTEKNVSSFVQMGKEVSDHVFVVGPIRVNEEITSQFKNDIFLNSDIEERDKVIEQSTHENDVTYISMSDLLGSEHLADGLHPNQAGHKLMFERIKETLEAEGIL